MLLIWRPTRSQLSQSRLQPHNLLTGTVAFLLQLFHGVSTCTTLSLAASLQFGPRAPVIWLQSIGLQWLRSCSASQPRKFIMYVCVCYWAYENFRVSMRVIGSDFFVCIQETEERFICESSEVSYNFFAIGLCL